MSRLKRPAVEVPQTDSDDPRVGHLIGRSCSPDTADVVLVGFPSDEGVRTNGGRPGSAEAPARIRETLYRMTPDARAPDRFRHQLERTVDLGDVEVTGQIERDLQALGAVIAPCLDRGAIPVILGGGHETAFGHFLGYVAAGRRVGIINWDAHPDVRPLRNGRPHSGSPFRQALLHESDTCRAYWVCGLARHQTATSHLDFLTQHEARIIWSDDLVVDDIPAIFAEAEPPVMVTFDIDAVDQSEAPGVSAPCVAGLSSRLWLEAAYQAGRSAAATSFEVVEMNPLFDSDGRTARLAAMTIWSILRGISERPSSA